MFSPLAPETKDLVEVGSKAISSAGIVAAAAWFFFRRGHRRSVQFDLECQFEPIVGVADLALLQLRLVLENKSQLQQNLFNFRLSADALRLDDSLREGVGGTELPVDRQILREAQIEPPSGGYFFVRPGVRQIITYPLVIAASTAAVRVRAEFAYPDHNSQSVDRVFVVPPDLNPGNVRANEALQLTERRSAPTEGRTPASPLRS